MVCNRCILVVKTELEKLGIHPLSVTLGQVELDRILNDVEKKQISDIFESLGFSLIDDKRSRLVEQIKTIIVELVHYQNNELKINLSDYLSDHIHHDYNYISNHY